MLEIIDQLLILNQLRFICIVTEKFQNCANRTCFLRNANFFVDIFQGNLLILLVLKLLLNKLLVDLVFHDLFFCMLDSQFLILKLFAELLDLLSLVAFTPLGSSQFILDLFLLLPGLSLFALSFYHFLFHF